MQPKHTFNVPYFVFCAIFCVAFAYLTAVGSLRLHINPISAVAEMGSGLFALILPFELALVYIPLLWAPFQARKAFFDFRDQKQPAASVPAIVFALTSLILLYVLWIAFVPFVYFMTVAFIF